MEEIFDYIIRLLLQVGPWIIFIVTLFETAIFLGLLLPAEATVLLAAVLAERGQLELSHVVAATLLGAFAGDQIGYFLGRVGGTRLAARSGFTGRMWQRYEATAGRLFRRHSIIGISLARFISFVRTLMPWFAGMSRVPYGRYVFFDALGVLGWGLGSIALGMAMDRSWRALADALGTASAVIVALLLLGGLIAAKRRRARAAAADVRRLCRVALTGNIASGKSSVVATWRALGADVIEADALARLAVAPGSVGLDAVARAFGPEVLAADGSLDRAAMRRLVFDDPAQRKRLEQILHPEIARLRAAREAELVGGGARVVVNDIPLLFEVGMQEQFDVVVLVDAPRDVRLERIVRDRGLDPAQAERMIDAQLPTEEKRGRADVVIDNDGTFEELREKAGRAWEEVRERCASA